MWASGGGGGDLPREAAAAAHLKKPLLAPGGEEGRPVLPDEGWVIPGGGKKGVWGEMEMEEEGEVDVIPG